MCNLKVVAHFGSEKEGNLLQTFLKKSLKKKTREFSNAAMGWAHTKFKPVSHDRRRSLKMIK
jgi:hypothetical protein